MLTQEGDVTIKGPGSPLIGNDEIILSSSLELAIVNFLV